MDPQTKTMHSQSSDNRLFKNSNHQIMLVEEARWIAKVELGPISNNSFSLTSKNLENNQQVSVADEIDSNKLPESALMTSSVVIDLWSIGYALEFPSWKERSFQKFWNLCNSSITFMTLFLNWEVTFPYLFCSYQIDEQSKKKCTAHQWN